MRTAGKQCKEKQEEAKTDALATIALGHAHDPMTGEALVMNSQAQTKGNDMR